MTTHIEQLKVRNDPWPINKLFVTTRHGQNNYWKNRITHTHIISPPPHPMHLILEQPLPIMLGCSRIKCMVGWGGGKLTFWYGWWVVVFFFKHLFCPWWGSDNIVIYCSMCVDHLCWYLIISVNRFPMFLNSVLIALTSPLPYLHFF